MKRIIFGIATLVVFTLVILSVIALHPRRKVNAQSGCSNATLSGNYGFYIFGTAGSSKVNTVGWFDFDGAGNFTGGYNEMLNGSLQGGTFSGTYSLGNLGGSGGPCGGSLQIGSGTSGAIYTANGGATVYRLDVTSGSNYATILTKQ